MLVDLAIASIEQSLGLVVPELVLVAAACVLFFGAGFFSFRHGWACLALGALAAAFGFWYGSLGTLMIADLGSSPFQQTDLSWFIQGISLAVGVVLVLLSWNQVGERVAAEYHGCLLLVVTGVNLAAAANDLVVLFLALELVSIPTYILLYLPRLDGGTQEAAVKYFLLSVFSSALTLFGFSYLFGLAGTTNLHRMSEAMTALGSLAPPLVLGVALVFVVAGLGFRITAAPFHFYAPDVYQGGPTLTVSLLAVVPKLAGFAALVRILSACQLIPGGVSAPFSTQVLVLFWILAAVSMCLGNFMGLLQDNLKRMLAYSGVAHAGYMLVGLAAGTPAGASVSGLSALWFYLAVYAAMTLGVFAVLILLDRPDRPVRTFDDLAGLGSSHPILALLMALFLFSLTGLPPAAGFFGKLWLLSAAWYEGTMLFKCLAVLLALNAAIGGWYYLRLVGTMYLRQPVKPLAPATDLAGILAAVLCAVATGGLFWAPGLLIRP